MNVTCYLKILTPLSAEQIAPLANVLEKNKPADMDIETAMNDRVQIEFETAHGDIPVEIQTALMDAKIAFLWEWEAHGESGAGMYFYDPASDRISIIRLHENTPVIPVAQAVDPASVRNLINTLARIDKLKG